MKICCVLRQKSGVNITMLLRNLTKLLIYPIMCHRKTFTGNIDFLRQRGSLLQQMVQEAPVKRTIQFEKNERDDTEDVR